LDNKSTKVEVQDEVDESSDSKEKIDLNQPVPGSYISWADV
jgi:hypothetical protein